MSSPIDLDRWPRRETFDFFRVYEQPFFNLTVPVDVSAIFCASRQPDPIGFFLRAAHAALAAIEGIPELRLRLRGNQVIEHRRVRLGTTILRPDETFAFCFLDYHPDLTTFANAAKPQIAEARVRPQRLADEPQQDDVVYLTSLPWTAFTSFEHASRQPGDCIPRLVFGRHQEHQGGRRMPVALALHHALADGLHAGRFFERFEGLTAR